MILLLISLLLTMTIPTSSVFTSMHDMEQLAKREQHFVKLLGEYIERMNNRLNQLKQLQKRLLEVQEIINADGPEHLDNPINGFLLLMRATTEWKMVENLINEMRNDTFPYILDGLLAEEDEEFLEPDFLRSGASQAMLRLQTVYDYSAIDLANNDIFKEPYLRYYDGYKPPEGKRMPMKARSCYYIAVECLKTNDYKRAIEWFNVALTKLKEDRSIDEVNVLNGLETCYYKSGRIKDALDTQTKLLKSVPKTELIKAERIGYKTLIKFNLTSEDELFYKLCREGDKRTIKQLSKLKCYHLDTKTRHPFLRLSLFKVEESHRNPDIFHIHDFYSEKEMDSLRKDSIPEMEYFQQLFYNQEQSVAKSIKTVIRHSKQWYINKGDDDANHTIAQSVTRRIEMVSGLNGIGSFFVFNYGLGGHQDQHFDSRVSNGVNASSIADYGSRQLATSNGFISDVEEGGATTFIYLGVAIKPKKGSLLYWNNLDRNGFADERMRHGACPVLQGSKWTVLHAFHIEHNELDNPCPRKI